jgi:hypothetical protein
MFLRIVCVQYKDKLYVSEQGIPTGVSCGTTLANLALLHRELQFTRMLSFDCILYRRYIDDMIALFVHLDFVQAHAMITTFTENAFPGMKINFQFSTVGLPFLDVFVDVGLRTNLYRKPFIRKYLPYHSAHPRHIMRGWIKAELIRFKRICDSRERYVFHRKQCFLNLSSYHGYPMSFLDSIRAPWKIRATVRYFTKQTRAEKKQDMDDVLIVHGTYIPTKNKVPKLIFRSGEQQCVQDVIQESLPLLPEKVHFKKIIVAWSLPSFKFSQI